MTALDTLQEDVERYKTTDSVSVLVKEVEDYKMTLKKLRAHYLKKQADKKPIILQQLERSQAKWESSMKKNMKLVNSNINKLNKNIDKVYDFDLESVYVNKIPTDAHHRRAIDNAIKLHVLRYTTTIIDHDNTDLISVLTQIYKVPVAIANEFVELNVMYNEMCHGQFQSAIEWCQQNGTSKLLFQLNLLQIHILMTQGRVYDAVTYIKHNIAADDKYSPEISKVMGRLCFPVDSEYYKSSEPNLVETLHMFSKEYCAERGLPESSSMFLVILSGVIACQYFVKYQAIKHSAHVDWSTKNELPFEVQLPPFLRKFHPIFICPVLKEETTAANPPLALPCHHIISKRAYDRLSRGGNSFKCPYCPKTVTKGSVHQVRFYAI